MGSKSRNRTPEQVRRQRKFLEIFGPVSVFLLAFGWFAVFARLDPDLHHDGLMLAAATAARDGLVIHRDVFQFHGAPISILQAWIAPIDGPNILSIRLLNALFGAATAMLLTFSRYLSVPAFAAYCSAILWIFLANFGWTNEPPIAMSAVLASTLLVGSFLLMGRYLISALGSNRQGLPCGYIGGLLLGFLILTRINVGLLALAASVFLAVLVALKRRVWAVTVPPLAGAFSPILVLVVYYFFVDGLASLWDDVIVFPRTYHGNAIFRENVEPFVTGERSLLPLVILGIAALVVLIASSHRLRPYWFSLPEWTRNPTSKSIAAASVIAILPLITFAYVTRKGVQFFSIQGASQSMRFLLWALLGLVSAAVAWVLISTALEFLRRKPRPEISTESQTKLYLSLMALSGLSILVPWLGPRYVWWGIPLGLLLLFWTLNNLPLSQGYRYATLVGSILLTSLCALIASHSVLEIARKSTDNVELLKGMKIRTSEVAALENQSDLIRALHSDFEKAVFLCNEGGWYSALTGSYRAASKYYMWNPVWLPIPAIQTQFTSIFNDARTPAVVCDAVGAKWIPILTNRHNYRLVSRQGDNFKVLVPSDLASTPSSTRDP